MKRSNGATHDPIITERSLALIGSFLLVFTLQMCLTLRDGLCGVALTRFNSYWGHVRSNQAGNEETDQCDMWSDNYRERPHLGSLLIIIVRIIVHWLAVWGDNYRIAHYSDYFDYFRLQDLTNQPLCETKLFSKKANSFYPALYNYTPDTIE